MASKAISAAIGVRDSDKLYRWLLAGGQWPLVGLGGQWGLGQVRRRHRPPTPYDLTGTYVTLLDYADGWDDWPAGVDSPNALARHLIRTYDPERLLWYLGRMNSLAERIANPPWLVGQYRECLPERWRVPFDRAMLEEAGGIGRIVAYRQPLLAAIRYVLTAPEEDLVGTEPPSLSTAVMLSHAVGVHLDRDHAASDDENLEELFMSLFPRWGMRSMYSGILLGAQMDTGVNP